MKVLQNKVAIVTGAGHPKGIGRAICRRLAAAGASVIATDLSGAEGLDSVAGELRGMGTKALALGCNVTDPESVSRAVKQVMEEFGRIDLLVNNAGVSAGVTDFLEVSESDWDISLSVNLRGVVNVCRGVIPQMLEQGGGAIVNIASLAGLGAIEGIPANYTASKFAVVGLTKQLSLQYAKQGIRVNAVCPGSIVTQMHERLMQRMMEEHNITLEEAVAMECATVPMGYSAQPEVIGDTVVFLASEQAAYLTGVAMPVAGGMSPGL